MGQDASGLFSGTRGSANSPYHRDAKVMQSRVKEWAIGEKERLGKKSERQKDQFNTATIVYDNESGRYFYGRNGGVFQENDLRNPQIFGENELHVLKYTILYKHTATPNYCFQYHLLDLAIQVLGHQ